MKSMLQLIVFMPLFGLSVPALSADEIPPGKPFQALLERTEALERDNAAQQAEIAESQAEIAGIMVMIQELKEWIERNQASKAEVKADIEALMAHIEEGVEQIMALLDDVVMPPTLEGRVTDLEGKMACVSDGSDQFDVFFEGCNVHVRNIGGQTDAIDGFGNLIVGYNEEGGVIKDRTGSHNIVIGREHTYSSYGGLVAGFRNSVTSRYATVTGGAENTASGDYSSVSGGRNNEAFGDKSGVSGGRDCVVTEIDRWGVGTTAFGGGGCVLSNEVLY